MLSRHGAELKFDQMGVVAFMIVNLLSVSRGIADISHDITPLFLDHDLNKIEYQSTRFSLSPSFSSPALSFSLSVCLSLESESV